MTKSSDYQILRYMIAHYRTVIQLIVGICEDFVETDSSYGLTAVP